MDLGALIASFGVDMTQAQQAERQLHSFDSTAQSVFSSASGHAQAFGGHMMALVGVTLSVAGAFALAHKAASSWYSVIESGIDKVENFKKEMISTSYLLAAQSQVPKPKLEEAYKSWGEYYKWMKEAALEADKAAASGMEDIMAVATQLLKKGVKAKDLEEFNVIARLTDVMKGAIPGYASLAMQARGEIEAILSGTARMGAQTAMILSNLDPEYKKNIANARATHTELEYFNTLLPKIESYTREMMGTMDAVVSSMKSAWSVVQIKAFGDAHKEVVGFIGELGNKIVQNGKLTKEGEALAIGLSQAWVKARISITEGFDYILSNFPALVNSFATGVSMVGSFVGTLINASMATIVWINNNSALLKGLAEFYVVYKITSWIAGLTGSIIALAQAHTAQSIAGTAATASTVSLAWATQACTTATAAALVAEQGLTAGKYLLMANANGAVTGVHALTAAISTGATEAKMATVAYAGLATTIGGVVTSLTLLAAAGGIYGAYKTFKGEAGYTTPEDFQAAMDSAEAVGGRTISPPFVGPPAPTELELRLREGEERTRKALGAAPPTPGIKSFGKPEAAGGGKGAEGSDRQVESIMSTLNQELMKINEGAANEVLGWAEKMVAKLGELQVKGADVSAAMPLVWQVALAKEQKLQEDFNKWYAGNVGDNYTKIGYEHDENVKNLMSQKTMEAISRETGKSMVDLVAQNETTRQRLGEVTARKNRIEDINRQTELLSLNKQYYDQMSQLSPTLEQQNIFKMRGVELENQMAYLAIDKLLAEKKYLEPLREELYARQAVVNQARLFNAEMERNKGFSGWAYRRSNEVAGRNDIDEMVKGLEGGIQSAWSTGFNAFLAQDKQGMAKAASNLVQSMMSEIVKRNITMLFDQVALKFKPEQGMMNGAQQSGTVLTQAGTTCGQNILSYAEMAASRLANAVPGGRPGGFPSVGGMGGGGTPYQPQGGGSAPGSTGGTTFSQTMESGGYSGYQAASQLSKAAGDLTGSSKYLSQSGQTGILAGQTGQQSATMGMISNMQLGLGAAGLGLGAIGLMTGSQGLVVAGMVLQTAAVGLQVAVMIMKATSMIPGAAHGAILGGTFTPIHSFAAGAPRISAPTLAWVGEGPNEEAVIPLQGGAVPVRFSGRGRDQGQPLVYSPTVNVGDGVNRDDKTWFKRELKRQKDEIFEMLRKGRRSNVGGF